MNKYIGISKPLNIARGRNANLDAKYGPYDTLNHAIIQLPEAIRKVGLTVGIITIKNGVETVDEYWWKEGTSDDNLELKVPIGEPLTVRKTYQTEALALADKNPIDTTTSRPLTVGQLVSIVDDGEKNGIYRISSISEDGTMLLELQGKLGDMDSYTDIIYAHIETISESLLSNYIGFEIDEDMNLIMSTPANYYGPEFVLENGELKVII